MIRAFYVLKVIATACAIAMCSLAHAQERPKIGAAVYGLKAEFMQLWAAALKAHPAVDAGDVELTIFDGAYDEQTQADQFQRMIGDDFDAILFVPIDEALGAQLVQLAHDAGIPVIGSNTRVDSDLLAAYIGSDDVEAGYLEAKHVLDQMACSGNVVILEGPIGQSAQISRLKGNQKALAECPDVRVLEQATANWQEPAARTLMATWLTAHGTGINGVIGQNDEMALGALAAYQDAQLDPGVVAFAGIDGVTDALHAVERGEMTSILQDAVAQSQGALDLALHRLDATYAPRSDVWTRYPSMPWNGGTDAEYVVPWTPVTATNVGQLLSDRAALQAAADAAGG
ncbi:MAG: substrate-binding domain-containing protein [Pseudomonadota bacterium]